MNKFIKNACSAFAIGCAVYIGLGTTTFTYGTHGSKTTKKVSKPDTKLKQYYDSLVNIQKTVNSNVGNVLTFMLLNCQHIILASASNGYWGKLLNNGQRTINNKKIVYDCRFYDIAKGLNAQDAYHYVDIGSVISEFLPRGTDEQKKSVATVIRDIDSICPI